MDGKIYVNQIDLTLDKKDLLNVLKVNSEDIVFLSGSLIEGTVNEVAKGMGNSYSDIDVFVLSPNIESIKEVDYSRKEMKAKFTQYCNIGVDIEIYNEYIINKLLTQLSTIKFDDETRIYNYLNIPNDMNYDQVMSFIHRMLNSIPLLNERRYLELKNKINENYYKIMIRQTICKVDSYYNDILGNLECKEFEVAILLARKALLYAMKAYIFYNKYSLDRDKWIPLILRNLAVKNNNVKKVYTEFKKFYLYTKLENQVEMNNYIENILEFNNNIISIIDAKGDI